MDREPFVKNTEVQVFISDDNTVTEIDGVRIIVDVNAQTGKLLQMGTDALVILRFLCERQNQRIPVAELFDFLHSVNHGSDRKQMPNRFREAWRWLEEHVSIDGRSLISTYGDVWSREYAVDHFNVTLQRLPILEGSQPE